MPPSRHPCSNPKSRLTGTNRDRPGLRLALAACRAGDTLLVTKPDRLARSLHDARDILGELTRRNVKLSFGGSIHNPTDLWEGLLFDVLTMVVFHQIPRGWALKRGQLARGRSLLYMRYV
jgi:hypothetical protein